jgi:hypothetical protein
VLGLRGATALFGGLSVAVAGIAVACSVYDSSLLLPATVDSGGGQDAADAGGQDVRQMEAASPCPEDFPPARPAMDDPSDAGDQSFIVALHTIDVGFGDAGTSKLGYDLDRVWTGCNGGGPDGSVGPESCKPAIVGATHPDDNGGRDDYAVKLLLALAAFDPAQFNATTVSQRLQIGTYSVLLQVLHYNGTPNDTSVSVGLYASSGVEGDAGARWNGNDSWAIDDSFVVNDAGPILPNHFDANAYVSGGTLVMQVNFPLSVGASSTGSFTITLAAGHITAQVVPTGKGTYSFVNGQITGRWNVSDMLGAFQDITVSSASVCPGSTYYTLLKGEACQYADIMTDPTQDLTGLTCDALSLGIGFTADPALLGPIVQTPLRISNCYPDGGAPDADSCGK